MKIRIATKVLKSSSSDDLEDKVNETIESLEKSYPGFNEVLDIKFSASNSPDDYLFATLIVFNYEDTTQS